jgi:hypothetical protein
VDVTAGDTFYIDYGVQVKTEQTTTLSQNKPSSLLGIIGALFLLVGIGLGVYVWSVARRSKPTTSRI